MLRTAALALVLLPLLPVAAAQGLPAGQLTLTLEGLPDRPILPEVELGGFAAVLSLACSDGDRLAAAVVGDLVIELDFTTPPDVVVTGPSVVNLDTSPCVDGSASPQARESYSVQVMRTAPGLQALPISVTATPQPRTSPWSTPEPQSAAFEVTGDYYSLTSADMPHKLQSCAPCKQVPFNLTLQNLGNAATTYTFVLHMGGDADWQAQLPPPVTVDPGQRATVAIFVTGQGGEHAFQLGIQQAAAADPSKTGNELAANFLVRDAGARDSPAPAVPLASLALLGLALLARRRA